MYAPAVDLPHNLHDRLESRFAYCSFIIMMELSQSYLRAISELSQSVSEQSQSYLRAISELSQSCSERNMECLGVSQSQGGVSRSVTWSGVE
eukprot:scaffold11780_cov82-Skeletonema_dohrnii-CCMP3373.AAC.2